MTARAPRPPIAKLRGGGNFLEPRVFIGSVHTKNSRLAVELWETSHLFIQPPDKRYVDYDAVAFIAAYSRERKEWIGTIDLRLSRTTNNEMLPSCAASLTEVGAKHERVFQIAGAAVHPDFKGIGIGRAMYIAAAALAARTGHGIAADACFYSSTSEDARRVWKSTEFRKHVKVAHNGLVGFFRGDVEAEAHGKPRG